MRKLGWIALVAFACACGDGDEKKASDAGAKPDGGRISGAGCGIEIGEYQGYAGPRVWNEAHLADCNALCPGLSDVDCIDANCEGAAQFFTCLDEQLFACQTSKGHDCRLEYEDLSCCTYEGCRNEQTDESYGECVTSKCSVEGATVEECYLSDTASESFVMCRDAAYDSCLVPIDCTPSEASPVSHYTGGTLWTRPWSADEFDSCTASCQGALSPTACRNATCPGAIEYRACVSVEAAACSTQPGAQCRPQWEEVFCCARSNCAGAVSNAELTACLDSACPEQFTSFNECNDMAALEGTCQAPAEAACSGDTDPDAGTPSDAGVDAATAQAPAAFIRSLSEAPTSAVRYVPTVRDFSSRGVRQGAQPWSEALPRLARPTRAPFTR